MVVIVVVVAVCLYLVLRICRSRNADSKYIPKPLKKWWVKWDVSPHHSNTKYSRTGDTDDDRFNRRSRMRNTQDNLEEALQDVNVQQAMTAAAANGAQGQDGVNRNTSVRSVMTLPAYRPNPNETEQVLGREGERAGIDTVVELPTAEDEEALREEEMNALYQIRLARRRQIAEREERREERRLARERQDHRALAEIRERARIASEQAHREVDELRESHDAIKASRTRAVSSVSYADLGVVRADGTRLRANSNESERMGLLSDAGSIALSTRESRSSIQHRRMPSSQSVLSIDTLGSNNAAGSRSGSPGPITGHSRASSRGQLSESYSMATVPRVGSAMSQRAGSSPELIDAAEADIGDSDMPLHSPPGYDDVSLEEIAPTASSQPESRRGSHQSGMNSPYNEPPPEYESPTQKRQKRLSAQMADLAAGQQQHLSTPSQSEAGPSHTRTSSRGVGGVPQLPSLRLNRLPQIVIEPSSAITPSRDHIDEEP